MTALADPQRAPADPVRAAPRTHAFRRLVRRRAAAAGLAVIALFVALAVLAPVVAPYDPLATSW